MEIAQVLTGPKKREHAIQLARLLYSEGHRGPISRETLRKLALEKIPGALLRD
jgi:hypothetical protein